MMANFDRELTRTHTHIHTSQPLLRQIYKEPPLISYKRGKFLKDILVRAKL